MARTSENSDRKERDRIGIILYFLYVLFLVLAVVMVVRIIQIQWTWKLDDEIVSYFKPSRAKSIIEPKRGAIIGCDGKILALSTPMYQLYMDCTVRKDYFATKKDGKRMEKEWLGKAQEFSQALAEEIGGDARDYFSKIEEGRKSGNRYLKLGGLIDRESLLNLQKKPLMDEGRYRSGIIAERKDTRQYPYGTLARRTIGYVKDNSNSNGNNHIGLEGKYDYILHGKEGRVWLRMTDNKERIQDYDSTFVKPEDGMDVRTTIDITIQDIADKAVRKQFMESNKIDMACAVVMETATGAIRAMVNLVRDPVDSSINETYNMAIGLNSEPGSVFKATTLMTALEDGIIHSLDETIPTNNGYIPGYPRDDHIGPDKEISYIRGFEKSSNYVFRYIAVNNYKDNPKKLIDKLYMYKLGQAFDFDLEGFQEPQLPSPDSRTWSPTDLGSVAMGYSVKETPLHILTFYNAIANKGKMMKPYLVESIERNGSVKQKLGPSVLNASICSRATADTLLRAMLGVTSDGTAHRLKGAKLRVAGKTGTAHQVLSKEDTDRHGSRSPYVTGDGRVHDLGTFVGFFPAEAPKYSAIICMKSSLVDERVGLNGGRYPASAMREIVDNIYALDPEWGEEIVPGGLVPVMKLDREIPDQKGEESPVVPDVTGLGLMDAMYMIENSGLKCSYSGTGHVTSQIPKAGQRVEKGSTVSMTLK